MNRTDAPAFADLDDLDSEPRGEVAGIENVVDPRFIGAGASEAKQACYEEPCRDCQGTGSFYAYTGRYVGECFKCKGKGVRLFKQSPETRAKQKEQRERRKASKGDENVRAFVRQHPELAKWMAEKRASFEFAASLCESVRKYGSLTPKQLAAAEKCRTRDVARRVSAPSSDLDLTDLPDGYYAVPNGETRLKLRVRRGKKNTRWAGTIFVDDGAHYGQRQSYGRQAPGQRYRGQCTEQLRAVLADPAEASRAYGKLTGNCGVCNRPLEDEESVARGIGPICASKTGW